jgi:carbonic anhydrase/acetyltransferase-like protein (isoleucine patch superfamily)
VEIEDNVSIGHNVVVHGARIRKNCLIGIGSILLDYSDIGENSIIAAGSVVLQHTKVEPGSIYGGVPAKFIKAVDPQQTREMIEGIAENYLHYAGWYRDPGQ